MKMLLLPLLNYFRGKHVLSGSQDNSFNTFQDAKGENHWTIFPRNCLLIWHHTVFKWYQQSDSEKGKLIKNF